MLLTKRAWTYRSRGHALVRIIVSARSDIFNNVSESDPKSYNRTEVRGSVPAPVFSLI